MADMIRLVRVVSAMTISRCRASLDGANDRRKIFNANVESLTKLVEHCFDIGGIKVSCSDRLKIVRDRDRAVGIGMT